MAGDAILFWKPGDTITCTPTAAVQGRRFVAISGNRLADGTYSIAPPAAKGRVLGVALWDAGIGDKVTVERRTNAVVPVWAAAALTAGQEVEVNAQGAVVPLTDGRAVGFAMTAAAQNTEAQISLY